MDVAIVGLGAVGSAVAYHLAREGARVVGFDQYVPPHTLGSTHGRTRIIREAYFEHPLYVPLVQRAYELWAELERECGRTLLLRTGGLMVGRPDGLIVAGSRRSAIAHGLQHEMLDADEVRRRFPGHEPEEGMVALLEPRAGMLLPEACVTAYHELARRQGAKLRLGECVLEWRVEGAGAAVRTATGERWRVDRLVLAAGAWMPELLSDLRPPLEIERQLFHWFEPRSHPERFSAHRAPVALWEYDDQRMFATLPDTGHGVKIGVHHEGEITTPGRVRREISPEEDERIRVLLRRFLPGADGRLVESRVCLYTNTPDRDFLIDRHPDHPQVILASPCSGHGFKFASAIGEAVAGLAMHGESRFDLSPFRLGRF